MVIDHTFYMSLAIDEAWKKQALTYPNPAVGALILDASGKILAIEATQAAGEAHAELHAIEKALLLQGDTKLPSLKTPHEKHAYILAHHENRLKNCQLYVTLEPCMHSGKTPPCSLLVEKLGFSHLICGCEDPNKEAAGALDFLEKKGIQVTRNVLKASCHTLLTPFRKWQNKKPFVFFKLALSANGVYDGGTITSKKSRTLVHEMRSNIDLLVIGGNTVRKDRPTLDSRLVNGKAPDILILSSQKEFDQSIPLFSVPNRQVFIEENFDKITDYDFVMIEGTETMLVASASIVDWYCVFTSAFYKKGKTIQLEKSFERLKIIENDHDTITWFKPKEK